MIGADINNSQIEIFFAQLSLLHFRIVVSLLINIFIELSFENFEINKKEKEKANYLEEIKKFFRTGLFFL